MDSGLARELQQLSTSSGASGQSRSAACRRWSFFDQQPLSIPAGADVTLACEDKELWLQSAAGPTVLGAQTTLTFFRCNLMLYPSIHAAVAASDASAALFGDIRAGAGAELYFVDSLSSEQPAVRPRCCARALLAPERAAGFKAALCMVRTGLFGTLCVAVCCPSLLRLRLRCAPRRPSLTGSSSRSSAAAR
jgi:hypothetical protein